MRQLSHLRLTLRVLQGVAIFAAAKLAISMLIYTILFAFGATAWLSFPMKFGEMTVSNAGMYMQIGMTVLVCAVALMITTNMRMNELERTHRSFQMSMDDVARACHLCHTADRTGVFTFSSEFDAVRERLAYLRDHPDLVRLEPDVLELAALKSQQSRHLADVCSDEKVERAKQFLTQRQEEAEVQQQRIVVARHAVQEIRTWAHQVNLEESVVASKPEQLDEKLQMALPELGYSLNRKDDNIVALAKKPATE